MDLQKLQKLVEQAALQVYERDQQLIALSGNEQSIVFRLGLYLNQLLEKKGFLQHGLSLDSEYNKYEADPKRLGTNLIRPDLLLHKRMNQKENLLAIECKRNQSNDSHDLQKLKQLTLDSNYKYLLGCYINFANTKPEFTYFVDGKIADNLAKVIV